LIPSLAAAAATTTTTSVTPSQQTSSIKLFLPIIPSAHEEEEAAAAQDLTELLIPSSLRCQFAFSACSYQHVSIIDVPSQLIALALGD
jgi:hypothetical protein